MYSCLEHIEEAMDRCLDDDEKLPILEEVVEPKTCQFCEEAAVYKVVHGHMESDYE